MKKNKMSESNIKKLIWTMGLPMIISMVLQALYLDTTNKNLENEYKELLNTND